MLGRLRSGVALLLVAHRAVLIVSVSLRSLPSLACTVLLASRYASTDTYVYLLAAPY